MSESNEERAIRFAMENRVWEQYKFPVYYCHYLIRLSKLKNIPQPKSLSDVPAFLDTIITLDNIETSVGTLKVGDSFKETVAQRGAKLIKVFDRNSYNNLYQDDKFQLYWTESYTGTWVDTFTGYTLEGTELHLRARELPMWRGYLDFLDRTGRDS